MRLNIGGEIQVLAHQKEINKMFDMFPVASSRITEMGYDADLATVYVRFTDGKGWSYRNVPEDVWDEFVSSTSKGSFINEVLNHYDHGPAEI